MPPRSDATGSRPPPPRGCHDAVAFSDTAGRLQIDEGLIEEVRLLGTVVKPDEVLLLVVDGALGQEAVNVAKAFHDALQLTGVVMTKMDGDARGGAALSIKSITGTPIKFVGTGEKTDDFDAFYPDRLASRILGMGDVVSLVERAQESIDGAEAERMAEKMRKADFNLEDFLAQMQQVKKMGSMQSIVGMLPGMSGLKLGDDAERQMGRTEAIIQSMTVQERRKPELLNGSRRQRIANGAGVKIADVNQLVKRQFQQMQKMMKMMASGGSKKMMRQLEALKGKGGLSGDVKGRAQEIRRLYIKIWRPCFSVPTRRTNPAFIKGRSKSIAPCLEIPRPSYNSRGLRLPLTRGNWRSCSWRGLQYDPLLSESRGQLLDHFARNFVERGGPRFPSPYVYLPPISALQCHY